MWRTGRAFWRWIFLVILLASVVLTAQSSRSPVSPVDIQMRAVHLHLDDSTVLEVIQLRGKMFPTRNGRPVSFDDPDSFRIRIDSAEVAITVETLSYLLNRRVFGDAHAPLREFSIGIDHGRIHETGILHRKIDIPFRIEGALDVNAGRQVRLHAEKVEAAHVPIKGLLHFFGSDLAKLVNLKSDRGVTIDGNDILIDPSRILPPPKIEGHLNMVRVDGNRILLTFGPMTLPELRPPLQAASYIYHHGGVLRFGKLTMTDSDLELVNNPPRTPFDFSLPDYNRQLVGGYSKDTPARGLLVFMPDFSALKSEKR
jgi:hypothetical protein